MPPAERRRFSVLRRFLESESSGGLVLMAVAALAMVVANSPAAAVYFSTLHAPLAGLDVLHWINDGLMAIFFLLVGLEIKREVLDGQLSTWSSRALPGLAALGGMVGPALVFVAFNYADPAALKGWAIPAATDIAFALGVISLLGKRVPTSLKIFLMALAIIDDLGAVIIIAIFYTADINMVALASAAAATALLIGMNRFKVMRLAPYMLIGAVLWFFVLRSGIHATIAGVVLALTIPLKRADGVPDDETSPLHRLEHAIAPWVAFLVIPIFGFANAGVSLAGVTVASFLAPIPLGVAAGLFFGKQVGVLGLSWLVIRMGWADLPAFASWRQLYGVSLLCGIGFTMSLFIGLLAFTSPDMQDATKLGVIVGSLASGIVGWLVLRLSKSETLQSISQEPETPCEVPGRTKVECAS